MRERPVKMSFAVPNHPVAPTVADDISDGPRRKPDESKNPAAVALGRLGGLKGGPARAARLTPAQRSEIASKAARARWGADAQGHEPEAASGTVIT